MHSFLVVIKRDVLNALSYHTHLPSGCPPRSAAAGSGCRARAGRRPCTAACLSTPASGRPWRPPSRWPWRPPGPRSGRPYLERDKHSHKDPRSETPNLEEQAYFYQDPPKRETHTHTYIKTTHTLTHCALRPPYLDTHTRITSIPPISGHTHTCVKTSVHGTHTWGHTHTHTLRLRHPFRAHIPRHTHIKTPVRDPYLDTH